MESRARASSEQLLMLLEFMENHSDLARPLAGAQGRVRSEQLWADLTNILNAQGGGVSKTTEKWKKVWADWKSKTKKKGLTIKQHAGRTGGGPASGQTLSASDKRVLAIMGSIAVEGQASVEKLGFNISQSSDDPVAQEDIVYVIESVDDTNTTTRPTRAQEQRPAAPSPPASPAPAAPSARRRPRLRSPATPQSAASPDRPCLRPRCRRAPTPFERAASEFTAVELRRLELEETRMRQQHERELRALEVEHERNQVFNRLVDVAQAWLDRTLNH
ncbi:uncharacterized protein LOC123696972 isoform X2 [Colias croceus]|uniref:uncharacterized protein LOC123696972 isoform X1 n=1 Tax=Colias crocea TaxID=72248 RepID=UPI001E27AAA2|nr:uncharacterized protein LOC123696972 isoform X1 [Colias croceus]XP_045499327.1 uncharacterized protein LOC123696972 isoform X2 [Colias croceus]